MAEKKQGGKSMLRITKEDIEFGAKLKQGFLTNEFLETMLNQSPLFRKIVADQTQEVIKFYKETRSINVPESNLLFTSLVFFILGALWSTNSKMFPNIKKEQVTELNNRKKRPGFLEDVENKLLQMSWAERQAALNFIQRARTLESSVRASLYGLIWLFLESHRSELEEFQREVIAEAEEILKEHNEP